MGDYNDNSRNESKYDHLDPEQRIAMLKAQKEKEKQKEIAEKEMAMKMAIEANRAEQRRKSGDTTNRAKAIAFDIDITSDKIEPKNMKVRGGPGSSGAATPADSEHAPSSQKSNQSVVTNYPSSRRTPTQEMENPSRSRDGTPNSLENISTKSNPSTSAKKGWGPPVDGKEILQARARGLSGLMSPDSTADEGSDQNPTPKTTATTTTAGGVGGEEENDEVMKRIESKRRSQLEVRHQAKEVLSKLREQRQMQAAKIRQQQQEKQKEQFQQSASSSIKRTISPLRVRALESLSSAETTKESTAKSTAEKSSGTPQRISLVERMKEKRESEAKQRSRSQSPAIVATPPPQQVKQNSRSNSFTGQEEKDTSGEHDQIHQNKLNAIEELSEELEDTLRTWLDHQKRGVTVRKKPPSVSKMEPTPSIVVAPQKGSSNIKSEFKDEFESDGGFDSGFESDGNNNGHGKHVHEEDDIGVYKTINNNRDERKKLYDHDDIEEHLMSPSYQEDVISPYDINKPLKGKYMDEDVEVVGMQCMLAKALMGDDGD
jgi:hypothetical protein